MHKTQLAYIKRIATVLIALLTLNVLLPNISFALSANTDNTTANSKLLICSPYGLKYIDTSSDSNTQPQKGEQPPFCPLCTLDISKLTISSPQSATLLLRMRSFEAAFISARFSSTPLYEQITPLPLTLRAPPTTT